MTTRPPTPAGIAPAFLAALAALAVPAAAQEGCPDLGFRSSYLEAFFCDRLDTLSETPGPAPTRNVEMLDPEDRALIEELEIVREAFEADPRRTLDLIERIRSAGGITTR